MTYVLQGDPAVALAVQTSSSSDDTFVYTEDEDLTEFTSVNGQYTKKGNCCQLL